MPLSGMGVLVHDEDDRSAVRFDRGTRGDDGSPLHDMVVDTLYRCRSRELCESPGKQTSELVRIYFI